MESLAEDLATMVRRPLSDDHIAAMRRIGTLREVPEGEIFLRTGDPADTFFHVLEGAFQLWDEALDRAINANTLGAGQFIGEIAFLTGGRMLYTMRTASPAKVLAVPRGPMLRLMAAEPEMSDIIVSVFAARRRAMLERNATAITIVGPPRTGRCARWRRSVRATSCRSRWSTRPRPRRRSGAKPAPSSLARGRR